MNNFNRISKLGEGVSGHVFLALDSNNQHVAIKRIKNIESVRVHAEWEITCWSRVSNHPNIVTLIEVTRDPQDFIISMECVKHDLRGLLESTRSRTFTKATVKGFIVQLLIAVSHCHTHNILHCDIKPENILYSSDGYLKLCDFGLARMRFQQSHSNQAYSIWYRAPELFSEQLVTFDTEPDIWAVGCVSGELIRNYVMFPSDDSNKQLALILGSNIKEALNPPALLSYRNSFVTSEAINFISSLLQINPQNRSQCNAALEHAYLMKEDPRPYSASEMPRFLESYLTKGAVRKQ